MGQNEVAHTNVVRCLPFMHFFRFPFLPFDFKLCKKLHGLFVYCLLELEEGEVAFYINNMENVLVMDILAVKS